MLRASTALLAGAIACSVAATAGARGGVPPLLFPVVGATEFHDDFGEPRSGGPHQGNDLVAAWRSPVVAVEAGTVNVWTTSKSAGCMLYLHGASGTTYQYIHLNNDLTPTNDNDGACVAGVAYAPGLTDGMRVAAGQLIGFVGDSGDANGIHPHLHFEVHPHDGAAVDPFPFLRKAPHLLVSAPPAGTGFTLKLTGTVVAAEDTALTVRVATLASWPSHQKQKAVNRVLTITLPSDATVGGDLVNGAATQARVTIWTKPALATTATLTGAPNALAAARVLVG